MSVRENIRFSGEKEKEQPKVFPEVSRVNLNNLMKKVKEEEKKTKRNSIAVSVAAFSAVAVLGIILTL
jgi:translation elongation factor EF-1beta|tara:strand:+ start:208 stop:411 length:204 start_codon:yes stop_codon:yes gene_type:complete